MNTKDFTDFCVELNEDCIRRQDLEKEIISDDNAFLAYAYIKNMSISDAGDVLLFCSCLNVLNTYVKQPNRKIGYAFKKELDHLVGLLLNVDIKDVLVDLQKEGKNSLLVVAVAGIQFSFHNVPVNKDMVRFNKSKGVTLKWDGVRKQMCARSIFESVKENKTRCSNSTFRGKNLEEKINVMYGKYKEGKVDFQTLATL